MMACPFCQGVLSHEEGVVLANVPHDPVPCRAQYLALIAATQRRLLEGVDRILADNRELRRQRAQLLSEVLVARQEAAVAARKMDLARNGGSA